MPLPLRRTPRDAEFIFIGTVVKRGAATMPQVPVGPTTTVVDVEAVYRAPPAMRFIAGKAITVVTRNAVSPKTGHLALFLAYGLALRRKHRDGRAVARVAGLRPAQPDCGCSRTSRTTSSTNATPTSRIASC